MLLNLIEVDVDQIDVPHPWINYLLGRLSLENFKKFQYSYNKLLKDYNTVDREIIVKKIWSKYQPSLHLPILIDKHKGILCPSCGTQIKNICKYCGLKSIKKERYWIRDGCHRFLSLVSYMKKKKILANLYYKGMDFHEYGCELNKMAKLKPLDGYPEIEKPLRGDGSPRAVIECWKPFVDIFKDIREKVEAVCRFKRLKWVNMYFFQSRVLGTCKPKSDIDVYVQLDKKHTNLVFTNGVNYKLTGNIIVCGEWAARFFSDLPVELKEWFKQYHVDVFYGIYKIPPAKSEYAGKPYFVNFCDVEEKFEGFKRLL